MKRIRHTQPEIHRRRGVLAPLIALVMLVMLCATALVLDHLWLDTAQFELATCAEAAALGAAGRLADDELLRTDSDYDVMLERSRRVAVHIAAENPVAAGAVRLDPALGDLRFGRLAVQEPGSRCIFLETERRPDSVQVTVSRTRARNNPVALVLRGVGRPSADLVARVEATVDNRIIGLRPFEGAPVPALPIAILKQSARETCTETWDAAVGNRGGADEFGYNAETGIVRHEPDGIPELVLRSRSSNREAEEPNLRIVDLGSGLRTDGLVDQIARGWTAEDLADWGSELPVGTEPLILTGDAQVDHPLRAAFERVLGQCRVCLLYTHAEPFGHSGYSQTCCVAFVAIRVMAVRDLADGACELVVQPGVLTTRTAVLADRGTDVSRNPYIYKLHLTR